MQRGSFSSVLLAVALLGCASTEELDKTGSLGGECYPNGTCNAAYVCVWGVCNFPDAGVEASAGGGTAGSGGVASGGVSGGGTGGFTGGGAGMGASSSGGFSTGGVGATGGTPTGGSGGVSTGGVGATGGTGGLGGTGAGGSGGSTGNLSPPTNVQGCQTCGCCDPWNITWTAVSGATYYQVAWKCSIFPVHAINVGTVTKIDLCSTTIGMCSVSECANGVGAVSVQACNASGCSAQAFVTVGLPLACGGGCCC